MNPVGIHSQVALLHQRNIDRGFLTVLGESFLTLLYQAIDADDNSVLLVEVREGRVVGFVAGTNSLISVFRHVFFHPLKLLLSLKSSIFRFGRLKKMFEISCYGRKSKSKVLQNLPRAELLSIVVSPDHRGRGLADALYARLTDFFLSKGVLQFKIAVGSDLLAAHRFYKRMGARQIDEIELHAGEKSVLYLHSLETAEEIGTSLPEEVADASSE